MSCTPTRILLSNTATTTMNVTLTTDPGDGTTVTFQVDGLGITETQTTTSAVAVFTITANTAGNNSLWDATLQVGTNTAVEATAQAVETNGSQTIGVTLSDAAVTYCSPLAGGGGEATSLTGPVLFSAKNNTGVTITKGSVVYIDGVSGNTPTVALADADDAAKMPAFGLAFADLADAATGSIITFGDITNVDTDAFVLDNPLYVSTTPGELTQTKPTGETSLIQNIGLVTRDHQSVGRIKVTGAGRSNDTPNLDDGNIFIGNASNQVTTTALSTLTGVTEVTGSTQIAVANGTTTPALSLNAISITGGSTGQIGITAVETINLATNAVTSAKLDNALQTAPGEYTNATVRVGSDGRLTEVSSGSAGGVTSVATGTGLTGGPITTTGTITHQAQPVSGTGPAFVKSVEIDALGHVSSVIGETTAGAYRTATGTDDADNLISGTVALARLPALAAAYTGQIETIADKTYTIDPSVVAGRTITSFYARSGAGTCTATLKNAALDVGVISVTTSSTTATISNTTVAENNALTIVVTSNVAATDVVFSVEFTQ